ncbi:MAG: sensor domain-containing diguanylate cyclase [Myxococcota bacterium]|jgi:diguanylate cyclase (GGDEF)-like protein
MTENSTEATRIRRELQVYSDLARALTSTLDQGEVLRTIMSIIQELLKPRNWSLLLLDPSTGDLRFELAMGESADVLSGDTIPAGEGLAGWVARNGKPILVADASADPRFCARYDGITSFKTVAVLCVPLRNRGRTMGVLELVNGIDDGVFTETDLGTLETIADFAAIAMGNAVAFKKISHLVLTDDQTGLCNARSFHETLAREVSACDEQGLALSLIMLDLDHFRRINEAHGHLFGNRVLGEIGALMRRFSRPGDLAVRYGGDEFILLMPRTSKEEAIEIAGRLRDEVRRHEFQKGEGPGLHITASFGTASYPRDARNVDDLMRFADSAMYRIKESTRDGVAAALHRTEAIRL